MLSFFHCEEPTPRCSETNRVGGNIGVVPAMAGATRVNTNSICGLAGNCFDDASGVLLGAPTRALAQVELK